MRCFARTGGIVRELCVSARQKLPSARVGIGQCDSACISARRQLQPALDRACLRERAPASVSAHQFASPCDSARLLATACASTTLAFARISARQHSPTRVSGRQCASSHVSVRHCERARANGQHLELLRFSACKRARPCVNVRQHAQHASTRTSARQPASAQVSAHHGASARAH